MREKDAASTGVSRTAYRMGTLVRIVALRLRLWLTRLLRGRDTSIAWEDGEDQK